MRNKKRGRLSLPLFSYPQLFAGIFNVSLCCRKACDGHAVRRAGNIRKPDLVAELDRRRIAAVFAANTAVHFGADASSEFYRRIHQLAYADRI